MSNALPSGWAKVTLGDVVDVRDFEREPINSTERAERLAGKSQDELFPYYGATGQVGFIDDYRSEGEQVLLGEDGAPFLDPNRDKAYIVNGRYWVNNHAHVLRGVEGVMSNQLLAHQLNLTDYHEFVTGSTRLKLTSTAMKKIPLLVPPPAEQTRIAEKLEELLSDLDAGVTELKAAQRKLAQYRQSLLKAAMEGTLTADWRAAHGQPQETGAELLQRILTERRTRWEQKQLANFGEQGKNPPTGWQAKYSEPAAPHIANLSPLPEGWAWASLDQAASETLIGLDRGQEYQSATGRVGYIKMNNVSMTGDVETGDITRIDADDREVIRYGVAVNDLLFNTRNSKELVGKVGLVRSVCGATVYNNNLMRIRFDGAVTPEFACHLLCSPEFRSRMEKIKKATTSVAAVYAKDLFPLAIPVPSMDEQVEIVTRLSGAFAGISQQEAAVDLSLKQSAAQRKNLLKAAFAGQLVPQDPSDEPASELLARIRTARGQSPTTRGRRSTSKARKAR